MSVQIRLRRWMFVICAALLANVWMMPMHLSSNATLVVSIASAFLAGEIADKVVTR